MRFIKNMIKSSKTIDPLPNESKVSEQKEQKSENTYQLTTTIGKLFDIFYQASVYKIDGVKKDKPSMSSMRLGMVLSSMYEETVIYKTNHMKIKVSKTGNRKYSCDIILTTSDNGIQDVTLYKNGDCEREEVVTLIPKTKEYENLCSMAKEILEEKIIYIKQKTKEEEKHFFEEKERKKKKEKNILTKNIKLEA